MQHRGIDRPDLELYARRIVKRLRERDFIPAEFRLSHVDHDAVCAVDLSGEQPCARLDSDFVATAFLGEKQGDATRRVSAGANLGPVGVEDAHEDIGLVGRLEHDHLIAARPLCAVSNTPNVIGREPGRLLPRVEDDEIIPQSVHLAEVHGGSIAHEPYMAAGR